MNAYTPSIADVGIVEMVFALLQQRIHPVESTRSLSEYEIFQLTEQIGWIFVFVAFITR